MVQKTHKCQLKYDTEHIFPRLHPNTSCFKRLKYEWKKLITINENCRESQLVFRSTKRINEEKQRQMYVYSFAIHPFSIFNEVRMIIQFSLWMFSFFNDGIWTAFFNHHLGMQRSNFCEYTKYIMDFVLIVDTLIFGFIVGYHDNNSKEVILEGCHIFRHHFFSYFVFDMLPGVAFIVENIIQSTYSHYILLGCTLLRLVRLRTVCNYLRGWIYQYKTSDHFASITLYAMFAVVIVHWLSCIAYFLPTLHYLKTEYISTRSWTFRMHVKINYLHGQEPWYTKYAACLALVVSNLLASSTPHFSSEEPTEMLFLALINVCGELFTIYTIGHLMQYFGIFRFVNVYENKMHELVEYARVKKLPQPLVERIISFYKYKVHLPQTFDDVDLSPILKKTIKLHQMSDFTSKVKIFQHLPEEVLENIILHLKKEVYLANDVIIGEDDEFVTQIFFISNGTVALFRNGEELHHLEDGDEFGPICTKLVQRNRKHCIRLEALELTEIYTIENKSFEKAFRKYPEKLEAIEQEWEDLLNYYLQYQ